MLRAIHSIKILKWKIIYLLAVIFHHFFFFLINTNSVQLTIELLKNVF